jgi:hypothetical protein
MLSVRTDDVELRRVEVVRLGFQLDLRLAHMKCARTTAADHTWQRGGSLLAQFWHVATRAVQDRAVHNIEDPCTHQIRKWLHEIRIYVFAVFC